MKRFITVFMLICIFASLFTVNAFADEHTAYDFATLNSAIAAAKDGDTITLTADITDAIDIIVINKAITLNGNGKTLTSTAGRAINVNCNGANGTVTIKNLTIDCTGERAINVITEPAVLTIDGVTAKASNYTVCLAGSASGCKVTINGGKFTGLNTLNIAASGSETTVTGGAEFITNDNEAIEDYATVCLNKDAVGAKATLQSAKLTYNKNDGKSGNGFSVSHTLQNSVNYSGASMNGSVKKVTVYVPKSANNYYSYTSLEEAAQNEKTVSGDSIVLLGDVDLDYSKVELPAGVGIDANGHKIINGDVVSENNQEVTVSNWGGTAAELQALKDGKIPARPVPVPATADNSQMGLWCVLFAALAVTAMLTRKKRTA